MFNNNFRLDFECGVMKMVLACSSLSRVSSMITFAVVVVVVFVPAVTHALYFHISETERKCFIEEVPDETLVKGHIPFNILFRESCLCSQ